MDLLRSLPIGSYLEQPVTWLHKVDPRVKLAWLMTFLIAPVLGNPWWRITLAGSLILLTIVAGIPFRVWRKRCSRYSSGEPSAEDTSILYRWGSQFR